MCIVACDRPQRCHIPGSRTYRQGSGFPVQIGANRSSFGVRRAATVRRSYLQTVGSTPDGKSFSQSREGRNGCTMVPFSRSKRKFRLIGGAQGGRVCYERAATSLRIVWISRPGGFYRTDSSKFRAIVAVISQGRRDARGLRLRNLSIEPPNESPQLADFYVAFGIFVGI